MEVLHLPREELMSDCVPQVRLGLLVRRVVMVLQVKLAPLDLLVSQVHKAELISGELIGVKVSQQNRESLDLVRP